MFAKVTSLRARRLFAEGCTIYMCACNMRPELFAVPVNAAMVEFEGVTPHRDELFDRITAACKYHNCINSETGMRVAYYLKNGG